MVWIQLEIEWIGINWIVFFDWIVFLIGLDWIGLEWNLIGLDLIGLDWIGLDWIGLDRIGFHWIILDDTVWRSPENGGDRRRIRRF